MLRTHQRKHLLELYIREGRLWHLSVTLTVLHRYLQFCLISKVWRPKPNSLPKESFGYPLPVHGRDVMTSIILWLNWAYQDNTSSARDLRHASCITNSPVPRAHKPSQSVIEHCLDLEKLHRANWHIRFVAHLTVAYWQSPFSVLLAQMCYRFNFSDNSKRMLSYI